MIGVCIELRLEPRRRNFSSYTIMSNNNNTTTTTPVGVLVGGVGASMAKIPTTWTRPVNKIGSSLRPAVLGDKFPLAGRDSRIPLSGIHSSRHKIGKDKCPTRRTRMPARNQWRRRTGNIPLPSLDHSRWDQERHTTRTPQGSQNQDDSPVSKTYRVEDHGVDPQSIGVPSSTVQPNHQGNSWRDLTALSSPGHEVGVKLDTTLRDATRDDSRTRHRKARVRGKESEGRPHKRSKNRD